jgi:hypothetical protein
MLLHRLEFKLEFGQVGLQLLDLLGLCKKLALEAALSTAAITTAVARAFLAITIFVHVLSP